MLWISKASPAFGSRFAVGAGTALCALGMTMGAQAVSPAILTIDLSNPSAVIFTGTLENASGASSGLTYFEGITLGNFFVSDPGWVQGGVAVSGASLTAVQSSTDVFTDFFSVDDGTTDHQTAGSVINLNISKSPSSEGLVFSSGLSALDGSASVDLSSLALNFRVATFAIPIGGDVYAGPISSGNIIGTWTAVPEASTTIQMSVVGLGCAGFLVNRARRRTA